MADSPGTPEVTRGLVLPFGLARGFPQVKAIANPAAGAGFSYPITGGDMEIVRAVLYTLVTSAAVANRIPRVEYQDGDGAAFAYSNGLANQAASTTNIYSHMVLLGMNAGPANSRFMLPLPEIVMVPGWSVQVIVGGIDVADQISGIRVLTERFPTGPSGYPVGVTDAGVTVEIVGG